MELALHANVGRVVCNSPTAANSGGWGAGLPVTDTLGGGTWAGNMTSENINWKHFLNYTLVSMPIKEHVPAMKSSSGTTSRSGARINLPAECRSAADTTENRRAGDGRLRCCRFSGLRLERAKFCPPAYGKRAREGDFVQTVAVDLRKG